MSAPILKLEIDELKNSIHHLERSNCELKDLLQTDPDPEYRIAIGENITTIAKKRARVAALEEELRRLAGEEYEHDAAVAVPACDEASRDQSVAAETSGAITYRGANDLQIAASQAGPQEEQPTSFNMEVDTAAGTDDTEGSSVAAQFGHRYVTSDVGAAVWHGVEPGEAPGAATEAAPAIETAGTGAECSGTAGLSSGLWL
ncbi:hypothetical protein Vafri_12115 [Volvox africanus]|uniref:Uncharacterized protein n=1 Tax=Volvox africanus TaxID=51714 RepID=A0A8J4F545_9CHLO|nr:hypothetical protein Vafri_12115 [Volvox africanus]